MNLPLPLLDALDGLPGYDRAAFTHVHENEKAPVSIRLNPAKHTGIKALSFISTKLEQMDIQPGIASVPWCSNGYYLPQRPSFTFDPYFHAGAYYVQEASSMFLEQVFRQLLPVDRSLRVLDLCAAPGGKSTLIQSLLSPESLLVSNETIRPRAAVLCSNIMRWGAANVVVTNSDPAHFSGLDAFFDVIVVDAPCSGSGLFRKEPEAVAQWSKEAVTLCSQRQQRILADVLPALKEGGVLVYATCSYSAEEDEHIADWVAETFALEGVPLDTRADWHISTSRSPRKNMPCYRFWPHQTRGEGFFLACFRKSSITYKYNRSWSGKRLDKLSRQEMAACAGWLEPQVLHDLYRHQDLIIYIPENLIAAITALRQARLHLLQSGIRIGKMAGGELIPDTSLALSTGLLRENVAVPLNLEQALIYLRKEPLDLPQENFKKGWMAAAYEGLNLGWLKNLGNRWNNYYPKEWRILKNPSI